MDRSEAKINVFEMPVKLLYNISMFISADKQLKLLSGYWFPLTIIIQKRRIIMADSSNGYLSTKEAKAARRVFNKDAVIISDRAYNAIIGGVLLWGFLINTITCYFFTDEIVQLDAKFIIITYFCSCIAGTLLVHDSKNAFVSFIGYNLIVAPVGILLSVALSQVDSGLIFRAFLVTTLVTIIMLVSSTILPEFFLSLRTTLMISLLAVIIAEPLMTIFLRVNAGIFDWIVVLIFCGYIGYDWSMANQYQKTVNNAVDSAADLYLDIINLFLRILRIFSRKRK